MTRWHSNTSGSLRTKTANLASLSPAIVTLTKARTGSPALGRVDECSVAENHLALFKAMNALDHCRRRQADAPAEFRKGNARVGLQLRQNLAVDVINLKLSRPLMLLFSLSSAFR